jgi:hypothetical protein
MSKDHGEASESPDELRLAISFAAGPFHYVLALLLGRPRPVDHRRACDARTNSSPLIRNGPPPAASHSFQPSVTNANANTHAQNSTPTRAAPTTRLRARPWCEHPVRSVGARERWTAVWFQEAGAVSVRCQGLSIEPPTQFGLGDPVRQHTKLRGGLVGRLTKSDRTHHAQAPGN